MKKTGLVLCIGMICAMMIGNAHAVEATAKSDAIITEAIDQGQPLSEQITALMSRYPALNAALVNSAITAVGADTRAANELFSRALVHVGVTSDEAMNIVAAALSAGMNPDNVTALAIANNMDATLVSQATAAGPATAPNFAPSPIVGLGGSGGDGGISESNQ
ncbi:hypothetical protein MHM93_14135 [Pseudoalteromonas sp. MM17-2]|uniref:hypothetical protein n=1 Tax=Pseudoalteromonas TaxID=53246 RepID=UPI001243CBBA|nr:MULTISPECIES: hypothetical protein [Pseudoalteromonas]MCG7545316.1 hypothetical protein [Pseudoalteromonas sp. MM17-2]